MKKIPSAVLMPSAALCLSKKLIQRYDGLDKPPVHGDVIYGEIKSVGLHSTLENRAGRIHAIGSGTRAVFVLGNRYAPDFYEGVVPGELGQEIDMIARGGVVGQVRQKNANVKDPTRVIVRGYVCDAGGHVLNTLDHPLIKEPKGTRTNGRRAKMILIVGSSMNSGKSLTAATICWALTTMGHKVRGSKVTGTASLKDILHMEDAGASPVADFTYFGHPSTYLLEKEELLAIFTKLDLKYANNPGNYWVVEIADGILQRETAMLLASDEVQSRIHRLIFAAHDALGTIAGIDILKERFGLVPAAISGLCSASPLATRELAEFTDLPVVSNTQRDLNQWPKLIL